MLNPVSFSLDFEDGGSGQVKLNPVVSNAAPTFTRATTATTVNREGRIISVASGVARSYYDPETRLYLGYLAEGARTNLCLQSEDLATTWTNTNSTESVNATAAPDGATTADKIIEDATAGVAHHVRQTITVANATAHVTSVFLKAGERTWAFLNAVSEPNAVAFFNLATGQVGTTRAAVTSSSIKAYPNGWYRCTMGWTSTGTARGIDIGPASADNTEIYNGDGVSGIFAWGAQLEAAAFASSYIPTTTASVTRNADVLTYTTQWLNAAEGTFLVQSNERAPNLTAAGNSYFVTLNDGTANNRVTLFRGTTVATRLYRVTSGGVGSVAAAGAVTPTDGNIRMAFSYASNDFRAYVNGLSDLTDSSVTVPSGLTVLGVGVDEVGTAGQPFQPIFRAQYFPVRLANEFLIALSSGNDPFTKPGVSRRLRKYKKDERLEKVFPKLRDEEPEVAKPKKAKQRPVERSVTPPVELAPDGQPLTSPTVDPLDLTMSPVDAPSDDAVSLAFTGKVAPKADFQNIKLPESVGEIPFAPIDQRVLEALFRINEFMPQQVIRPPSKAELFAMGIDEVLNHPDVLEIEKAVWMKN